MKACRTLFTLVFFIQVSSFSSCANGVATENESTIEEENATRRTVSKQTKEYWFDGKAELSSYKLTQARYGELHEGTAVLVYVTEPFSKAYFTKADEERKDNVSVLKLNVTKKFNTGIYPYSMMNSSFFPFEGGNASLKIASSLQEWCGMTYLEMKNEGNYTFNFHSYFEGLSFKNKTVKPAQLEDDLWSLIRTNPELLPVGEQQIIPSMFFLRLRSSDVKAYKAIIKLSESNGVKSYELNYPELERKISIQFETGFPYRILAWQESHYSGYGKDKKLLTSKAELIKTIKTDYWNQNLNEHKIWREKLGL